MSKNLIPNEKKIIADINKSVEKLKLAKKGYVNAVIEMGENLIIAKKKIGHGEWINYLNANSELAFGIAQAQKYMQVAENKLLVLEFFSDEQSLNALTHSIANKTDEQVERIHQIKEQNRIAEEQAEKDRKEKAREAEAKRQQKAQEAKKQDDIIEGEFTEEPKKPEPKAEIVKPGFVQVEESIIDEMHDRYTETMSHNESLLKEIGSVTKILDSGDAMQTALKEIKVLTDTNVALNNRQQGHLDTHNNERRALINQVNHWKKRAEKAEKKLSELGYGNA